MPLSLLAPFVLAAVASAPLQDEPKGDKSSARTALTARPPGLRITFVNDLGEPLAGEEIHANGVTRGSGRHTGWSSWGLPDAPGVLDEDGAFLLTERGSFHGDLMISFANETLFGHAARPRFEFDWDGAPGQRSVTVPRTGAIEGRVMSKGPYHGIGYAISNDARSPGQGLHSPYPNGALFGLAPDETGRFRIDGLTPGEFEVFFRRGQAVEAVTVTVAPGQTVGDIELPLDKGGGWIVGRVDFGGRPVSERTIVAVEPAHVLRPLHSRSSKWLAVDGDGAFRAGTLLAGLYRVSLHHTSGNENGWTLAESPLASDLVWCDGKSETTSILTAPGPPVQVRGSVTHRGRPAGGLSLVLHSASGAAISGAVTKADGRFELQVEAPGQFELTLKNSEVSQLLGPYRTSLVVRDEPLDLVLRMPEGAIEVVGLPPLPAENEWSVRVRAAGDHERDGGMRLDAHAATDGIKRTSPTVHFGGLAPGSYTVEAQDRGIIRFLETTRVEQGETVTVHFEDRAHASIRLSPDLEADLRSGAATVRISTPGGQRCATFWSQDYTWREWAAVPAGPITVFVRRGNDAAFKELYLAPRERRTVDVELRPGGTIEVDVRLDDRCVQIPVRLRHESGLEIYASNLTVGIPQDGPEAALYSPLPAGRYTIRVGGRVRGTVDLVPGETRRLRFDL